MSAPEDRPPVSNPPDRPLLVWDGDCTFCRLWVERWRARTHDRVDYDRSLTVAGRFREIPVSLYQESVVLILPDGTWYTGAEAALRALTFSPRGGVGMWLYRNVPGFAPAAELSYSFVARNRYIASRATRLLWGSSVLPPTYGFARCLFLRLLGLVYLIAFVSLWVQVDGLIGSNGILPTGPWLESVEHQFGFQRFFVAPTLAWLGGGDTTLHLMCATGVVCALLLMAGLVPILSLAGAWGVYLSLSTVSRVFLGFQWDALLLEIGFLAIFLAPLRFRCRFSCAPPSRLAIGLAFFLIFRFMFASGVVKLASGDPTWWTLTALDVHYETQPLPTWTSWYIHQFPSLFHKISTLVMFFIELVVPFTVVAPRRIRLFGAAAMIGLQLIVMATGNYGFFNLLTIVLLLLLIDDAVWPARWIRPPQAQKGIWPAWVLVPVAVVLITLGGMKLTRAFRVPVEWPAPLALLERHAAPFHSVNAYGLFARMTTTRPEIIIEGSNDQANWIPYEFKWKPGDPNRRPVFVTPYMPRLDWQMWFAALGSYQQNPWFAQLLTRLLTGSPEVLALLEENPFPEGPPRFIRCVLYDYRFAASGSTGDEEAWWTRRPLRAYTPVVSLREENR